METLIAKQPEGYLTEAEAIMQARTASRPLSETFTRRHCRCVYSLCFCMIKESG